MTTSTVERAYELARAGEVADFTALKSRLKADGFRAVDALLSPRSIQRHLQAICAARASAPSATPPASKPTAEG
jgi:hypothetical protein